MSTTTTDVRKTNHLGIRYTGLFMDSLKVSQLGSYRIIDIRTGMKLLSFGIYLGISRADRKNL